MYRLQVFSSRRLETRQSLAMLEKVTAAADRQGPSSIKVVVPFANVHENPFPTWLQQWFQWAGLKYDDFNFCYYLDGLSREQAAQCTAFIKTNLFDPYPGREDVQRVEVRTIEIADGLDATLDSF